MSATLDPRALFQPIQLSKEIRLENRVALAPLTRFRANPEHEHEDVAIEYYVQRCHTPGTLLITEATFISPQAGGFANVPGISTPTQIARWKAITDAVHAKGGKLVMQLWALGRAADPKVAQKEGFEIVSAGNLGFKGGATPRPLTIAEIKEFTAAYALAAHNFVNLAGGDGVELHSANGYLIDQFFQTASNNRTDRYGGSVENRTRFGREVIDALVASVGASRVGFRLSPYSPFQGMKMPNLVDIKATFSHFASSVKASHPDLLYLHAVEGRVAGIADVADVDDENLDFLRAIWAPKPFVVAGGFTPEMAIKNADKYPNTIVAIGRAFIANPDWVQSAKLGRPLTRYDRRTFYTPGPQATVGYTSYQPLEDKAHL